MLKKLWLDESGVVLSTELILITTILVVGSVVGLAALKTALVTKLADVAGAVTAIDPTFGFSGGTYVANGTLLTDAYTNGSEYIGAVNATDTSAEIGIEALAVSSNTSGGSDQIIEQDAP